MARYTIKKGLDLPISGAPNKEVTEAAAPKRVALVAQDYLGIKPKMAVNVGDEVKRGQTLFIDRTNPGVQFVSPGAGKVAEVNRGAKRALISVVIELSEADKNGEDGISVDFENYKSGMSAQAASREEVKALLCESGLWTGLRGRPFSRVAAVDGTPKAIFVTAMDSTPLSPDPLTILQGRDDDIIAGLHAVSKLTDGKTYVCKAPGAAIPTGDAPVEVHEFSGQHPAGTVGVHIHTLCPVNRNRSVWHIGYQDLAAIGHLFNTGKLDVNRFVGIGGPQARNGRIFKTRFGAEIGPLLEGETHEGENRIVYGSPLNGRPVDGPSAYLGRYFNQVSVLLEGREREFLGWLAPGFEKFSISRLFVSKFFDGKVFDFTTTTNGSHRAMVPIGLYEKVLPMDLIATYLLRALLSKDLERAEELGALELDEEDLALCTYVCPGKSDYGTLLRSALTQIEKEG